MASGAAAAVREPRRRAARRRRSGRSAARRSTTSRCCCPSRSVDYVDFYSSIHHATNLGRILRPDSEPLLPNWRHLPVGVPRPRAARSSSSGDAGRAARRPRARPGRRRAAPSRRPVRSTSSSRSASVVGGRTDSRASRPTTPTDHVFGVVLLNDWSARDIQAYEYQPLGPHLGKSFATTISPWVVTLDALRAVPRRAAAAGSRARPATCGPRCRGGSTSTSTVDAQRHRRSARTNFAAHVLDVRPAARPHDRQRRAGRRRRPVRLGHRQRARRRPSGAASSS